MCGMSSQSLGVSCGAVASSPSTGLEGVVGKRFWPFVDFGSPVISDRETPSRRLGSGTRGESGGVLIWWSTKSPWWSKKTRPRRRDGSPGLTQDCKREVAENRQLAKGASIELNALLRWRPARVLEGEQLIRGGACRDRREAGFRHGKLLRPNQKAVNTCFVYR